MGDAWDSTQVASVDLVTAQKWNDMVIDQKSRAAGNHTQGATTVNINTLGSPTYDDVQDWVDVTQSGGRMARLSEGVYKRVFHGINAFEHFLLRESY